MKTVCLFLMAVAVMCSAEPPRGRYRPAWVTFQRQEEAPAPYPPSGWRPYKAFTLPTTYGVPSSTEAPQETTTTTEAAETTTTEAPETTTTEAAPEVTDAPEEESRGTDDYDENEPEPAPANIPSPGVYYVLLPDGTIQRVAYQAVIPAPPSGRYIVEQVEPPRAPLYAYSQSYNPGSPGLIRILKK
ncbi:hypothetical protein J437_LFUL006324 [Ladona fulva]|uniref:DUF4794 domain-containing protein n=1 Tax=Ladona fulva TaxID=123851 RepID=A0A8K0NYB4_LADFU|nr:hypothetical protein J437_LFUL006324 [Ladona fulva]